MSKYTYSYTTYKDVQVATDASRRFNSIQILIGILTIPIGIFSFIFFGTITESVLFALVIAIFVSAAYVFLTMWILQLFHDPYVVRKTINSLNLSSSQKKTLIHKFTDGKIIGDVDLSGALSYYVEYNSIVFNYNVRKYSTEEYKRFIKPYLEFATDSNEIRENELKDPNLKDKIYYFENDKEYNTYLQLQKDDLDFHWENNPSEYLKKINYAEELYKQDKLDSAYQVYMQSLSINPIGFKARYRIIDILYKLNQNENARDFLLEMKWFFNSDSDIANYYRMLGEALFKTKEYEASYAAYKYSLYFEEDDEAFDGMSMVEKESGESFESLISEKVLRETGYLSYVYL